MNSVEMPDSGIEATGKCKPVIEPVTEKIE